MQTKTGSHSASGKAIGAVLLFVACCLLSTAHILFEAPGERIGSDETSKRSDQRFAKLKARLPTSGVIGYLGEDGDSAIPDYYLTQYALAPLVVDFSRNHPLVIGNFPSSRVSVIPPDLTPVEDFGNGVLLFASRDAK